MKAPTNDNERNDVRLARSYFEASSNVSMVRQGEYSSNLYLHLEPGKNLLRYEIDQMEKYNFRIAAINGMTNGTQLVLERRD